LRDGLFPPATASPATAAASAAAACGCIPWRTRRRCWLIFWWRLFGGGSSLPSSTGLILSKRRRRGRDFSGAVLDLRSRVRGLFCVKICGLQRRWSRLIGWPGGSFFAALQALAHPFAHARLLTQMRVPDQCGRGLRTIADSGGEYSWLRVRGTRKPVQWR